MVYETIVGRNREDLDAYGNKVSGFIGKHIVGTGEDAHLTTPVFLDLLRPHVILITGKRGTGKSYTAGVIAEEIAMVPEEKRKDMAIVLIDTMGIYWSIKRPNEQQIDMLRDWGMRPKAFENVRVYVPFSQLEEFEEAGIPVDGGISIAPHEFSAEEWRLAFNLKPTEPAGVALEKNINKILKDEKLRQFTIDDLITTIRDDTETEDDVKYALINILTVAAEWGVFGTEGTDVEDIVSPGEITIVDVSHLRATGAWSVRNFIVAIIARKIYQRRLIARKQEEIVKMTGDISLSEYIWEAKSRETKRSKKAFDITKLEFSEKEEKRGKFPLTWIIIDEAHNFVPADFNTVSSAPLSLIAKQGREPGISLVVMTQMPSKVHQYILSQCDIVFSHRLTSRGDLEALHSVMQTYMSKELWTYIGNLPKSPGAAIILDDNMEKVFTVQIRPRASWHAGGTAALV